MGAERKQHPTACTSGAFDWQLVQPSGLESFDEPACLTSVTSARSMMPRGFEVELTSASMKRKMYPCTERGLRRINVVAGMGGAVEEVWTALVCLLTAHRGSLHGIAHGTRHAECDQATDTRGGITGKPWCPVLHWIPYCLASRAADCVCKGTALFLLPIPSQGFLSLHPSLKTQSMIQAAFALPDGPWDFWADHP